MKNGHLGVTRAVCFFLKMVDFKETLLNGTTFVFEYCSEEKWRLREGFHEAFCESNKFLGVVQNFCEFMGELSDKFCKGWCGE